MKRQALENVGPLDLVIAITLVALIAGWLVVYAVLLVKYGELPSHEQPLPAERQE
jgi:hypothetical protein